METINSQRQLDGDRNEKAIINIEWKNQIASRKEKTKSITDI